MVRMSSKIKEEILSRIEGSPAIVGGGGQTAKFIMIFKLGIHSLITAQFQLAGNSAGDNH